jgi:N-acetyl sugar amidotransferase
MPRYCRRCVLPDTRPGVALDAEGVCAGCRNAERKRSIDWAARAREWRELAQWARARRAAWDCVVPVSGGKDSYWQLASCLEAGLRPLCVTYVYPGRSALGEANLRQLQKLGADHLEFRADPQVERRFIEKAFRRTAISGLPAHMAIYALPLRVAAAHGIPLVVYGENSAFEYGSDDASLGGAELSARWLAKFGVTAGTTAADWVDEELTRERLALYFAPEEAAGVRAIFLGHFLPWDPERSRALAERHGFRAREQGPRVGHANYVNIDDDMIGVHHHAKWHKFGITRSFDTLSMEIRAGRLTREQAIEHLRARGDETPWDDIRAFCAYLGIDAREYWRILEGFRDRGLWTRRGGKWVIDGFLVPGFAWPDDPASGR